MTLKEKFTRLICIPLDIEGFFIDIDKVEEAEQIADDYTIGFAEWLYRYDNTRLPNGNWIIKLGIKPYTSKEVLEIYKKEKGL